MGELDEIAEVLDGAVAAALVEIHHEGRTVGRRKDHALAADLDAVGRIAGVLGEACRGGFQDLAQHARLEPHQQTIDIRTCGLPVLQGNGIVAELNADFSQDPIRRCLDLQEIFFAQNVIGRDVADYVGRGPVRRRGSLSRSPAIASAGALTSAGLRCLC